MTLNPLKRNIISVNKKFIASDFKCVPNKVANSVGDG